MRRGFFALGSLAAVALATPAWAGDVTVIETSEGSRPIAVKKDVSALAAVPKMADGKENQGFSYGALYELPGAGIRVMRGHNLPSTFRRRSALCYRSGMICSRGSGVTAIFPTNGRSCAAMSNTEAATPVANRPIARNDESRSSQ